MQAQSPKVLPAPEIPAQLLDFGEVEKRVLATTFGTDPARFIGLDLASGPDKMVTALRHPDGRFEILPDRPRMLVFCGTRKAIERYDMLPDWAIICAPYPPEQRQKTLNDWLAIPGAKLAVDRSMLHGWRCPSDTLLLFDPSWPWGPDRPETMQAVARRNA